MINKAEEVPNKKKSVGCNESVNVQSNIKGIGRFHCMRKL